MAFLRSKRCLTITVLAALCAALAVWPATLSAQTTDRSLALCRANVSPCQDAVSIGVGDVATFDLVLSPGSPSPGGEPPGLLAWETHLVLSGDTEGVGIPANPPVQAPDGPILSFAKLSDYRGIDPSGTGYFQAQNRFDAVRGLLDYAVVLIGPNSPSQWSGIPLFTQATGITLGSVQVDGVSPGIVAISGSRLPTQVVLHEPGAGKTPVHLSLQYPLATLSVGSVTTPSIAGRIQGLPAAAGLPFRDRTVRVSLWDVGAVPPWRGGAGSPKVSFNGIPLSDEGAFEVSDIAPSLAPPGPYVVRVKVEGALSRSLPGVILPRESGSSPVILADIPPPLYGDSSGDDRVDSVDLDYLKDAFGSAGESSIATDFNHDGVTDVADFSVMALNYGEVGE